MRTTFFSFLALMFFFLCFLPATAQDCTCDNCSGTGWKEEQEPCNVCGGSKQVTCIRCNGKGSELCTFCFESGVVSVVCQSCGGTGSVDESSCGACQGTGKVNEKCINCDGRGRLPCGRCGETGTEGCTMCFGTGFKIWKYPCSKCGQKGTIPCQ